MKKVYTIITCMILSGSLSGQELMHTTEFYWAEKFSDRSVEIWGVLEVGSPIFNDFLANAPDDRIVINNRGCEFHTDGTEDMSGYPSWVGVRAELREDPMSIVPSGSTRVYEYIWDIDLLPHLEGPVTIFQRFHKGNDRPDMDIELAGEGQFYDASNGTVIVHGFNSGWVRTQKELQPRNHLLVAIYSDSSGHYKISLNGETLIENDAYTIADTTYSGQQFGIYNHGGTVARIQFTHIWYRCREYSGKADFSQLNSTDPNVTSVASPERVSSSPQDFILKQNYPNPFNPKTTLSFSIPETDNVVLTIYNSNGEIIAELINRVLSGGTYKYEFDGSDLASGVYFYQLSTNHYVDTKKFLLLK